MHSQLPRFLVFLSIHRAQQMYFGGSVVGKASTNNWCTPPLIFTGGQKVRN